ncbi:MAG: hypothetical protein V5A57_02900, partial [Candidatus Paceibacterota bacterium]
MSLWLITLIFILSSIALVKSGTWLVKSLTRIARFLKWREFTVAFILMAFATSIPELFVGITSGLQLEPELSFGNVIGSNIINLTLVVAVVALLAKGLNLKQALVRESGIYTMIIAFLPVLLLLDGAISRMDGLVLFLGLAFYLSQLKEQEAKFTKEITDELEKGWSGFKSFFQDIGLFVASTIIILVAAHGIVLSATSLVAFSPFSIASVGILIVALGTGLPELIFGLQAVNLDQQEMIMGGIMGSVVSNSTLVLGTTVLIHPLRVVNYHPYLIGIAFTVLTITAFTYFSRTDQEINQGEALGLLVVYVLFAAIQ